MAADRNAARVQTLEQESLTADAFAPIIFYRSHSRHHHRASNRARGVDHASETISVSVDALDSRLLAR